MKKFSNKPDISVKAQDGPPDPFDNTDSTASPGLISSGLILLSYDGPIDDDEEDHGYKD